MPEHQKMIKQIIEMLKAKIGDRTFFGKITFTFEAGKIITVRESRTHKMQDK